MDAVGRVEVVCGPMFAGKTEELLRRVRRAVIAGRRVVVFTHALDTRHGADRVASHIGRDFPSAAASTRRGHRGGGPRRDRRRRDRRSAVLRAGPGPGRRAARRSRARGDRRRARRDLRGRPFEPLPSLMALAEDVAKLTAICTVCGEEAVFHVKVVATPAGADDLVAANVGGDRDVPGAMPSALPAARRSGHGRGQGRGQPRATRERRRCRGRRHPADGGEGGDGRHRGHRRGGRHRRGAPPDRRAPRSHDPRCGRRGSAPRGTARDAATPEAAAQPVRRAPGGAERAAPRDGPAVDPGRRDPRHRRRGARTARRRFPTAAGVPVEELGSPAGSGSWPPPSEWSRCHRSTCSGPATATGSPTATTAWRRRRRSASWRSMPT